jgi:integrase
VSEAIGLQWQHVQLDGDRPHVKVRRGIVRGMVGPPKSKYGKRDVPLSRDLVHVLRARRSATGGAREDVVLPTGAGKRVGATSPGSLSAREPALADSWDRR